MGLDTGERERERERELKEGEREARLFEAIFS